MDNITPNIIIIFGGGNVIRHLINHTLKNKKLLESKQNYLLLEENQALG